MSAAVAAAAAAANSSLSRCSSTTSSSSRTQSHNQALMPQSPPVLSRYESQKRRDWNTFGQYLKNHRPPLALSRCSGAHVLEFLRYLDQFGKTKVHADTCPFFGHPHPPAPCPCPLRQAWGSLDALIGRLRAAFEENGGQPETNPFGARAVRLYLREVRDSQAKARGIAYEKKKRRKPQLPNGSQETLEAFNARNGSNTYGASGYGGLRHEELSESNGGGVGVVLVGGSSDSRSSLMPLSVLN